METPSFTFRLERVRTMRERAEDQAREELARELELRVRSAALLQSAADAVALACDHGRHATGAPTTAAELVAVQAHLERTERDRREAALALDRQDAQVAARRDLLADAARDRQAIAKLEERQRADHDREWALRAQNALDEIALGMHRRGGAVTA